MQHSARPSVFTRNTFAVGLSAVGLFALTRPPASGQTQMDGSAITANAVVTPSRFSYTETVSRLTAAIAGAGFMLFAHIDHSAAAAGVGLTLRPTTLLIFGNPKAGTPLMNAFPLAALDLPLKFLVWEDGGAVSVAYTPIQTIANRYDVTGQIQLVETIQRGVSALLSQVK
jgi:uncharacterized protein (DUF302 family)